MKISFSKIDVSKALILPEDLLKFLDKANGEFIKVYIYLLKNAKEDINTGSIADELFMLEADVIRAVRYWEINGLLNIDKPDEEYESKKNAVAVSGVRELEDEKAETAKHIRALPVQEQKSGFNLEEHNAVIEKKKSLDLEKLNNDEEFSSLVYLIQQHMKSDFNSSDMYILGYIYDELKLSSDLIEYLIDLCVKKGKPSLRYMEKIAIDWHAKGIRTVREAKENSNAYSEEVWGVMRALGQNKREPAPVELGYIKKWFGEWAFTKEIVIEACERAVLSIQQPSFNYVDGILEKWHTKSVKIKADIERLDKEHENKKEIKEKSAVNTGKNKINRFNNFEQREDDFDAYVMAKMKKKFG